MAQHAAIVVLISSAIVLGLTLGIVVRRRANAATAAVLDLLKPGDEVITTIDVYGGTYRLATQVYSRFGVEYDFVDTSNP